MLVLVLNSGSSSIAFWLLEVLEKRGMGSSSDMGDDMSETGDWQ